MITGNIHMNVSCIILLDACSVLKQVMGHISDEEWSSGRCFTESSACESASSYDRTVGQCSSRVMVKKGFVDPMLGRKEKLGIVNHQVS